MISDISACTCTRPWPVPKHTNQVLGLGLGTEAQVLGVEPL